MNFNFLMPSGWSAVLWLALLEGSAHGGLWFWDKRAKHYKSAIANDVTGIIFSVLALIYSLLLAFVIVAVWENYESLNRTIERETDHLSSVLVHSNMLSDSLSQQVDNCIRGYCSQVVKNEWNMLDMPDRYRQSAIPNLRLLLFKVEADTKVVENVLTILDQDLSEISSLRRDRLGHTRSYVPGIVWHILLTGSIIVIVFSYFFDTRNKNMKRLLLSFLWAMMGMSLFLLYTLDHPFIGSAQVSKQPYENILHSLEVTLNGK